MTDTGLIPDISAATAEYGMQCLANWLPADRHAELRELLYDLTIGAITAFRDAQRGWGLPSPSTN